MLQTPNRDFQKRVSEGKKSPDVRDHRIVMAKTKVVFKRLMSEEVRLRSVEVGIEGISQL